MSAKVIQLYPAIGPPRRSQRKQIPAARSNLRVVPTVRPAAPEAESTDEVPIWVGVAKLLCMTLWPSALVLLVRFARGAIIG